MIYDQNEPRREQRESDYHVVVMSRLGITLPAKTKEHREFLIAEDICPECGEELNTGWECTVCRFDAHGEAMQIDIDGYNDACSSS